MKFYTSLRAGLNACGYNPHLLPILPRIRPDADLVITPIVAESVLVIGSGNDPSALRTPNIAHWQRTHDSLGMILYALFLETIRSSASHAYQALHNGLRLGKSNGFAVLHEIVRMHHPSVANSLAPSYASIYNQPPVMKAPGKGETYELPMPLTVPPSATGRLNCDATLTSLIFALQIYSFVFFMDSFGNFVHISSILKITSSGIKLIIAFSHKNLSSPLDMTRKNCMRL
jgi:hypothetical protein